MSHSVKNRKRCPKTVFICMYVCGCPHLSGHDFFVVTFAAFFVCLVWFFRLNKMLVGGVGGEGENPVSPPRTTTSHSERKKKKCTKRSVFVCMWRVFGAWRGL